MMHAAISGDHDLDSRDDVYANAKKRAESSTHRGIHISKVSKATQRQSHTEAARDETGALTERDSTEIQLGEYKNAGSAVALTSPPRIYLVKSFALKI